MRVLPANNVLLVNAVHRANQLHPLEVAAMQLGQHRLKLCAVKHCHDRRFNNVVEMMPQRDFVAAQLLRSAVQIAAAHACAEVAGVVIGAVGDIKYVGFKNRNRHIQHRGIFFDLPAVDFAVAGIHDQKNRFKMHLAVTLKLLHQLRQQHGILSAGDADRDFIPLLNQLIPLDSEDKRLPNLLAICGQDAALDPLMKLEFSLHAFFYSPLQRKTTIFEDHDLAPVARRAR